MYLRIIIIFEIFLHTCTYCLILDSFLLGVSLNASPFCMASDNGQFLYSLSTFSLYDEDYSDHDDE